MSIQLDEAALADGVGRWASVTPGLRLVDTLDPLVGRPLRHLWPIGPSWRFDGIDAVVGWGMKQGGLRAAALAQRLGLPYVALEDGFLRSVGLGDLDPPLSLAIDHEGIYYDASRPSRLERLIAAPHTPLERARAARLAIAWRAGRVSKYNHARESAPPVEEPFVLVVDQTFGDMSIALGQADAASFGRMLEAALDENPGVRVVLKVHPDVIAGRKQAHFAALTPGQAERVVLLASDAHPPALLEGAQAVYVVTSQMGFEGLLWGRPVRCFGMPFYAGWGLTRDERPRPPRRSGAPVTLEDLVHASLVDYPRYIDPETRARCHPERVIEWMALQRRQRMRFPARVRAIGFSEWKRPIARAFFAGSDLLFEDAKDFKGGPDSAEAVATWGRPATGFAGTLRVEDGFLRSVGLGAQLVQPLSWVIDRRGIYYDATAPSDLENLLASADFDAAVLQRAASLRAAIVAGGVTKYNVGSGNWQRPASARTAVLVPGQVEDDASIAYGAPVIRTNLDLLRAVRAERPDAWIVYKPHPDVLAGKRPGEGRIDEARALCDEIVTDVPIHRLFDQVDEVHVLTSLAGFEALLRGRRVVCHGLPFYAGWGLTDDRLTCTRRQRVLPLDALVAATLIVYPTYVSRTTGRFTTPERVLQELADWHGSAPPREPLLVRLLRRLKQWRDRQRRRKL